MATALLDLFYNAIPTNLYTGFAIRLDHLPDTPVNCILLEQRQNTPSTKYFGQKSTLNYPLIEITVRSDAFQTGFDVCENIRDYFDMYSDTNLGGVYINGNIGILGKDLNGYRRFYMQATIIKKE